MTHLFRYKRRTESRPSDVPTADCDGLSGAGAPSDGRKRKGRKGDSHQIWRRWRRSRLEEYVDYPNLVAVTFSRSPFLHAMAGISASGGPFLARDAEETARGGSKELADVTHLFRYKRRTESRPSDVPTADCDGPSDAGAPSDKKRSSCCVCESRITSSF